MLPDGSSSIFLNGDSPKIIIRMRIQSLAVESDSIQSIYKAGGGGALQSFIVRQNIRHQIADQRSLGQWFDSRNPRGQFGDARVFHLAVHQCHASFASVGIDAAVANRQAAF